MKSYPEIPVLKDDEELLSTFGCCEMEMAALRILKQVISEQNWEAVLAFEDFIDYDDDNKEVLKGFIMLAAHGWLIPWDSNGDFVVKPEFADQIMRLLPIDPCRRNLHWKQGIRWA